MMTQTYIKHIDGMEECRIADENGSVVMVYLNGVMQSNTQEYKPYSNKFTLIEKEHPGYTLDVNGEVYRWINDTQPVSSWNHTKTEGIGHMWRINVLPELYTLIALKFA